MRILIVGAGEVGSSIAASLADTHEVVVVDIDPERVDALTYGEDVLAIQGDGTKLDVLEEAECEKADIVIASTDSDETNLAITGTIDTASDAFTIARVQKTAYLDTWRRSEGAFGVDFMVSTDLLAAQVIVRIIGVPTAREVDPFSGGLVQMAEFEVPPDSPLADERIADIDHFDGLTFAAILRNGDSIVPSGDDVVQWGDNLVVIGRPESVQSFATSLAPGGETDDAEEVVIIGGSATASLVAGMLEDRGYGPRIIERDPERARELAEEHPESTVLEHDANDIEFLEREHVRDADVVVASLDSDAQTLLAALLAKQVGVERTVAVVDEAQYVELFEAVGVDVAVNPRKVTAEEITRFTLERPAENVAILDSGAAEVLEFEVAEESVLAGLPIQEGVGSLPDGVVIGAITRDDEYITPRGDTEIQIGDHVVLFVTDEAMDDVVAKV